jgi:radical SAM superfamily enzyme with C-terminal helix-hairpin-helix motif
MIQTTKFARAALVLAFGLVACGGADDAPADDAQPTIGAADTADTAAAAPSAMADGALIDPNDATREQLLAIPNMNETLADAIIQGRPYDNMLEVDSLLAGTLSETQRDEVYAHLFHPLDLNTATGEEILLIPNLGDRMVHEFEEYRPYDGIERFRREIGKYVDENEVARLERYVTIR